MKNKGKYKRITVTVTWETEEEVRKYADEHHIIRGNFSMAVGLLLKQALDDWK